MAAKTKALAANRRRRRARKRATPAAPRSNPPIGRDLAHVILPGFAAYAVTRFLSRIVYMLVQKRYPRAGKHVAAAAAAAGFGAAWLLAHRVKKLEGYHDGIVVGSGIAALQTVARTYLPGKYAYIVSDYHPSDIMSAAPPKMARRVAHAAPTSGVGDEFDYLEAEAEAVEAAPSPASAARAGGAPNGGQSISDFLQGTANGELDQDISVELGDDEDLDDLYSGSFAESSLN